MQTDTITSEVLKKLENLPQVKKACFIEKDGETIICLIPEITAIDLPEGIKEAKMPNGQEVYYLSEGEVEFFYEDIFNNETYFKGSVTINPGDFIIDIGANVGFFSMFVSQQFPNCEVLAFEPAPPIYNALTLNVLKNQLPVSIRNFGLSDREGSFEFTYYPHSSGFSTFHGNHEEEKELMTSVIKNQLDSNDPDAQILLEQAELIAEYKLQKQTYQCQANTLSAVIREEGIDRIDLLKVDVEKSELPVLKGIAKEHWNIIKQVVVEVHDIDGTLNEVLNLLQSNGFKTETKKDPILENTVMTTVFAVNSDFELGVTSGSDEKRIAGELSNDLLAKLPEVEKLKELLPEPDSSTTIKWVTGILD